MERKRKAFAKVTSLVLAVMMLMSVFSVCFVADAALVEKTQRTYDIAVAFDNSNSMYMNGEKAWCQAKYAMEIFASMLNYENGDKLTIFPMWEVSTDNTFPKPNENTNKNVKPVVVDSKEDIDLISNMFVLSASGTPFAPVREAYEYLKGSEKTNKWLIVLTDGAFTSDERNGTVALEDLQGKLESMSSEEIQVQYLAMKTKESDAVNITPRDNLFAKTSDTENLQSDLNEICNRIFKRSILNSKYIDGNKITIDVSMNNIIVFAQGADEKVRINGLKNAKGESVGTIFDSKLRKYSEISGNETTYLKPDEVVVDTTLFGHVVTFVGCPKGEYTLDCSGAKNFQIFYEPNVDILVTLKEKETGEEVYNSATSEGEIEVVAGKHRLDYKIIDRLTGEDVSESDLLGNVDLKAAVVTSDGKEIKVKKDGIVELKADESTFIKVSGTYLYDYTITTEDNKAGFSIRVRIPEVDDLQIEVEGADNWYTISQNEKWQPMKAKFTLNGQPLTAEQMKSLEFAVKSSKESLQLKTEMLDGESAAIVYIAKDEAGNFVKPETGIYTLEFAGQLPANEYGLRPADSEKKLFEIQNYAEYWRWLIYVVAFAILLAIFLAFMSQKVLPKRMDRDKAKFWTISAGELDGNNSVKFDYSKKGKSITVSGPTSVDYDEQCSATFTVKAVDNRFTPSKKRRTAVVGISSSCEKVKLGVVEYVCVNGQWVKATAAKAVMAGKDAPVLEQVLSVSPSFELIRAPGGAKSASLKCSAKTKK